MSGDYSRNSHRPEKAFSQVRMQQGRLFTDADWNEQAAIARAADRADTRDTVGRFGIPDETPEAFSITPEPGTGHLLIGGGRAWLEGRMVESPGAMPLRVARVSGAGVNKVWRVEEGPALSEGMVILTEPDTSGTTHVVTDTALAEDGAQTFRVTPAMNPNARTEAWVQPSLQAQPFAPPADLPQAPGTYLAYLTVWDHAVTALDDPDLRDVAWDGPDTATREATLWQVSLIGTDALEALGQAAAPVNCADFAEGLSLFAAGAEPMRLAARARLEADAPTPCTLAPGADYAALVNHLYRVERMGRSALAAPHILWSRDNAMHRAALLEVDAGTLVLSGTGQDPLTALGSGDWVEIRDRDRVMGGQAGFFARIAEVNGDRVTIDDLRDPDTLDPILDNGQPDTAVLPVPATLRRWEGGLPQPMPAPGDWRELENGVQIVMEGDAAEPGAFWTIPARTVTGDVDWPRHPVSGAPELRAPEGPGRVHGALALLQRDAAGTWTVLSDCRPVFPALSEALDIHYVSGDGQAVAPDPTAPGTLVPVPQPLTVAAVRGRLPVANIRVRFTIIDGNGRFFGGGTERIVTTGADGLAAVNLEADATTDLQRVAATQVDAAGGPLRTPVVFATQLRRAALTSFDPANTPALAGATEVQTAIELLARLTGSGCSTHVILPDTDWAGTLRAIPAGEDVAICFAPGTYTMEGEVVLEGLGHVTISGSGPGVRLVGRGTERTLTVRDCASLDLSGIEIDAPDNGFDFGAEDNRDGALTVRDTAQVTISGARFACGDGAFRARACLTIRGRPGSPLDSVRVEDCHFAVGHLQEALLIHDSRRTRVIGNAVAARPGQAGGAGRAVVDPILQARLVDALVADPLTDPVLNDPDRKALRAGEFTVAFASAVPQSEWDAALRAAPPNQRDLRNETAFLRYSNRLIERISAEPALLPSLEREVARLGGAGAAPDARVTRAGGLGGARR
ncbi:MAG: DUF6519 domain-containing protein, partial [Roseicyclus sp.]